MTQLMESSPLSSETLESILTTKYIGRPTIIHNKVTSTNTLCFKELQADTPHGTVILAEQQSTGKGRLGRTWHSPFGKNLYFSIALSQTPPPHHVSWIPLLTGVALAQSLELASGLTVSLKWPNDIMVEERKLGGVLCEGRSIGETRWVVVVGIGININSEKDDFPQELQEMATSLTLESHRQFDRHALLAMFLGNFESHYERLLASDVAHLHSQYISRCTTLQRTIHVHFIEGNQLEGFAVDIGTEGELQVVPATNRESHTTLSIRSGDVFHVR